MSYQKGELKLSDAPTKANAKCVCGHARAHHAHGSCSPCYLDSGVEKCSAFNLSVQYYDYGLCGGHDETIAEPVAYLPHSCDEWIIGGRENIKALIADLQEMLD